MNAEERVVEAPRRSSMHSLPLKQRFNPVFVTLHATDAELCIYARLGRMAPTERTRLRNAIGELLSQYGRFNATINLDDGAGTHHG